MRRLAVYLKNYKKESILAPFFKFLEVVFDLLVPVVIARMIDVGIAGNNREVIIQNFFYPASHGCCRSDCQYYSPVFCRKGKHRLCCRA